MGDGLRVGLCLTDKRRQAFPEIGRRGLIEALIDLAGGDRQGLARWAQAFLTRSRLRVPVGYKLSLTFDATPSRLNLQAWANISAPSTSKLSLNWMFVPATRFFRAAFRPNSGAGRAR